MSRSKVAVVAVVACATGCAHVTLHESTDDRLIERRQVMSPPVARAIAATATVDGEGASIVVLDRLTCEQREQRRVRRHRVVDRRVDKLTVGLEIGAGLVLAGLGAYAAFAPADAGDLIQGGVEERSVRIAGFSGLGVGGLLLGVGALDLRRAGDSRDDLGIAEITADRGPTVACGTAPRASTTLALAVGSRRVPLGPTDAQGRLAVPWTALPDDLLDGPAGAPRGQLVTGSGAQAGALDLASARAALVTRAWTAAQQVGSAEAFARFAARFPGERAAELAARARPVKSDAELVAEIQAATELGSIEVAASKLAELKARPGGAEVALASGLGAPTDGWAAVDRGIAADADAAGVARLQAAVAALAALATAQPDDPRLRPSRKALNRRQATVAKLLLAAAGKDLSRGAHEEALARADLAVKASPDRRTGKARTSLRRKAIRVLADTARRQARAGDLVAADAALATARAIDPADRAVARAQKAVDASRPATPAP